VPASILRWSPAAVCPPAIWASTADGCVRLCGRRQTSMHLLWSAPSMTRDQSTRGKRPRPYPSASCYPRSLRVKPRPLLSCSTEHAWADAASLAVTERKHPARVPHSLFLCVVVPVWLKPT